MTKLCAHCGLTFEKKINESVKVFLNRHKFCCKKCEVDSRRGKPIASIKIEHHARGERNNKWKGGPIMKECLICSKQFDVRDYTINKRDTVKCCSRECSISYRRTDAYRIKLSNSQRSRPEYVPSFGKKMMRYIRRNSIYNMWRAEVLKRDDYTCKLCNKRGGKLCVDHIKPFIHILRDNQIDSYEKAIECVELWDIANARTLCYPCHYQTDTFGSKALTVGILLN